MRGHRIGGLCLVCWLMGCSSNPSSSGGSGGSGGSAGTNGGSGGSGAVNTTNPSSTTGLAGAGAAPASLEEQVSDCTESLEDAEITTNLELVESFDHSVHELVACGGITVRVVATLVQGVFEMLVENDDDITPDGLVYEGNGTYRSVASDANQEADMLLEFYDTSSGEAVPIPDDVFLASTYLVGARAETVVEIDEDNPLNSTAFVEIEFDAVGPQVELLGFGPEPTSPIRIESSDVDDLGLDLDEVVLATEVTVVDDRGDANVNYDVETGPDPVLEIFDVTRLNYRILDVSGANPAAGQELALVENGWQIEFAGGNKLVGRIDFSVKGGAFDYEGKFTYDSASYADIQLDCAD